MAKKGLDIGIIGLGKFGSALAEQLLEMHIMVMGVETGQRWLDNHPELECLLIYADSSGNLQIWQTDGMPAYIR